MYSYFTNQKILTIIVLLVANLIASLSIFTDGAYSEILPLSYLERVFSSYIWGTFFLLSSIGLSIFLGTKEWKYFVIGMAISLFTWTNVVISVFIRWFNDSVEVHPIVFATLWFIWIGQLIMFLFSRGEVNSNGS